MSRRLRAEDARRESSGKPVAPRVGKILEVDFSPDNSGTWEVLEDGSRLWRIRISSPGALSLSLGLKDSTCPKGQLSGSTLPTARVCRDPTQRSIATPAAACRPRSSSATSWWPSCICRRVRRPISSSNRSTTVIGALVSARPSTARKGAGATSTSSARRATRGATRSVLSQSLKPMTVNTSTVAQHSSSTTRPRTSPRICSRRDTASTKKSCPHWSPTGTTRAPSATTSPAAT